MNLILMFLFNLLLVTCPATKIDRESTLIEVQQQNETKNGVQVNTFNEDFQSIRDAETQENSLTVRDKIRVSKSIIADVTTPNNTMKFPTLNKFTSFVSDAHNQGQTIYKMLPIPEWWTWFFRRYSKRDESKNDIEILFKPNPGSRIGHYVCVFYNHQKRAVFIYDPLYVDGIDLHPKVKASLEQLYPSVKSGGGTEIVLVKPGTTQPDNVSCGLFSIAYATALIFGLDPKDMKLKLASSGDPVVYLRKHLEQIYRQRRITLFPMDSSLPIASSLSASKSSTNSLSSASTGSSFPIDLSHPTNQPDKKSAL